MNPDTQTKILIFLERLWLIAACIGVAMVVYFLIVKDNDSAVFFFGFFILSGLCILCVKGKRVKHQANIEKHRNNKDIK